MPYLAVVAHDVEESAAAAAAAALAAAAVAVAAAPPQAVWLLLLQEAHHPNHASSTLDHAAAPAPSFCLQHHLCQRSGHTQDSSTRTWQQWLNVNKALSHPPKLGFEEAKTSVQKLNVVK